MIPAADTVLTQMRKGVLEFCVLAFLRRGPAYGLEIATSLGRRSVLFASEGTLYPLLSRLRKQGWVETSWEDSRTGPPRRYYSLTGEGRAAVEAFAAIWVPFSDGVDDVLREGS